MAFSITFVDGLDKGMNAWEAMKTERVGHMDHMLREFRGRHYSWIGRIREDSP